MTQIAAQEVPQTTATCLEWPERLPRRFPVSAWLTLVRISLVQIVRGRRLLALAGLFTLPTLLTLLARWANADFASMVNETEDLVVFYMIPQALVPMTALVLSAGLVRDEIENQTLTYLLIRPLPRWSIYIAKLMAAWLVAAGLTAVFVTIALAAIHWGSAGLWGKILPVRACQVALLSTLALLVYTALFGALSLVLKWVFPLGVAYIVIFEGAFANFDFMIRRITVLWHVRVLAERWLGLHVEVWSIDLDRAPSGVEVLLILLTATLVFAAGAALLFGRREFRVKTPE
jgi:ABC-2 type transport system permease protein